MFFWAVTFKYCGTRIFDRCWILIGSSKQAPVKIEVLVELCILGPAHRLVLIALDTTIGCALVKAIRHALHVRVTIQMLKRVLPMEKVGEDSISP